MSSGGLASVLDAVDWFGVDSTEVKLWIVRYGIRPVMKVYTADGGLVSLYRFTDFMAADRRAREAAQ